MYEFDLNTLYTVIRAKRKRIIVNCIIAFIVALIIGYSIPKEYSSTSSLLPEISDESTMGGLSSLASAVGLNMDNGGETISPLLYPEIVNSNKFIIDLLDVDVETNDGTLKTDYYTYVQEHTRIPWWGYVSVGISKCIKMILPEDTISLTSGDGKIDPFRMTKEDSELIETVRNKISCSVDEETMILTLSVSAQDPLVAATMVDTLKSHLQKFIIDYNTNKAKNDLEYYNKLEANVRAEYDKAQKAYAVYCDTHNGIVLQSFNAEKDRLENEMQLAFTAYSQIVQNKQLAAAKVQKCTPAFTELEGPSIAHRHDSPKKMLIVFALVFVTFVGSLLYLYVRLLFSKK